MRGLLSLIDAALLLTAPEYHYGANRRQLGDSQGCGAVDARKNSSWQLVVPESVRLQSKLLSIRSYNEDEPETLLGVLSNDKGTLAPLCSSYVGVQFPGFGSAWTKLRPCLTERSSSADVIVVRSEITVGQCASRCPSDETPARPSYCSALPPGAESARLPSVILARSGPFEKFVSDLLFAQSRRGLHSRRARALAGAGAAAHAGAGDAGAAAEAEAEPDATAAENSGGDDPLALQCSLEAIVAAAFARSVGGVHFCATNSSAAEDVLEEMSGYDADERTQLLRWLTGAAVAVFAGFLLSRVQHLIHAYPTVFSLSLNTFSSVGLIFTNKVLYQRGCDYAVTLVGMNFLATSSVNLCVRREGKGESKGAVAAVGPSQGDKAKVFDTVLYVFLACTSLITSNLSLLLNSVGFYQISKLMIIPTSCVLEFLFQGKRYSAQILATVVMVLVGVGAATVSDVTLSLGGGIVAFISVLTMSAQQVLAAVIQQKYNLKADAFVAHVAPYQAAILIGIGPFLDRLVVGGWPWEIFTEEREKLPVTLFFVCLSSVVAILVNLSQAMAIGVASAVAFQVLGHSKTVLVLVIAWLFFDSSWTARSLIGAVLALVGIISYGFVRQREQAQAAEKGGRVSQSAGRVGLDQQKVPPLQPMERARTEGITVTVAGSGGVGGGSGCGGGGTPRAGASSQG